MAVLERLKHPDDAEFVEVVAKYSDNNPDIVLVGGRVRAVNSFRHIRNYRFRSACNRCTPDQQRIEHQ